MFAFGKHGPDGRYGALLDIGSASATIAIVVSDPSEKNPSIIWSAQERCPVADGHDAAQIAKLLSSAVVNSMLTLGSQGLQALTEYDPKAALGTLQVTISAPWTYTVTKTVRSNNDELFEVTDELLTELARVAEEQALELVNTNDLFKKLGLEVISHTTVNMSANGYNTNNPTGQMVDKLTLSQLLGVSQKQIIKVVEESHEKIIPKSTLSTSTFMLNFYRLLQNLEPDIGEVCLVDITGEATEIGIVRDGILQFVTHGPHGHYTLARAIAQKTKQPYEEVLGALKQDNEAYLETVTNTQIEAVNICISEHISQTADLLGRTGDALSIPKTLFLHTDSGYETFFTDIITKAAETTTRTDHVVHGITQKFFSETKTTETKTLLSAAVFHKKLSM